MSGHIEFSDVAVGRVRRLSLRRLVLCIGACTAAGQGLAQQPGAGTGEAVLEEILVTASKRGAQSLQSYAGSAYAVQGSELAQRGAADFADFALSVPSLQFQDLGPGDKEYIIRGINSSGPSTVGVYFDEAVVTGGNQQDGGGRHIDIKLVDVQRIEVLNGPQGTLYGANSMSGVIRYIPHNPDTEAVDGFVAGDLSYTDEGSENFNVSGMVNLPLVEGRAAIRVVGWHADNSGWIDQIRLPIGRLEDINSEETTGGRIMLRLDLSERLSMGFWYMQQNTEVAGSSRYTPEGTPSFGDPASGFPSIVTPDEYINTDITQSPWDDEVRIASANFTYDFAHGALTGTVNNFERELLFQFDSSPILFFFGVPAAGITVEPQEKDLSSAEVRYASSLSGPLNFVVGAYAQREDFAIDVQVLTVDEAGVPDGAFVPGPANDFFNGGNVFFGRQSRVELDQEALFGEVTYDFNDRWSLLAGLRYFQYDIAGSEQVLHDFVSGATLPPNPNEDDRDQVTGKLSLSYRPADDLLYYATYSEGFRVGGLNDVSFGTNVPRSFAPDELNNYELGFKTSWNDRFRINGAAFFIDWEEIQIGTRDSDSGVPFIANFGDARILGAEIDLTALLSDSTRLELGGSFTDAELTTDQPPVDPGEDRGRDGDRFPNVARTNAHASFVYDRGLDIGNLTLRGDLMFRGSTDIRFDDDPLFNHDLDSFTLVNLSAAIETDGGWNARLFVNNATDERTEYDAISSFQDPLAIVGGRPRTIGVSLRKDF